MTAPAARRSASYDFGGQVAVVTGGASGIGAAVVHLLRASGAIVVVWDVSAVPGDAHALQVDVADRASVARAAQETATRWGGIDIVVHSAGFTGPTMPLDQFDPEVWHRVVDVNLGGTFHVCHAVVPLMRAAARGRIVLIASLAGKEGTLNASAYSAAKAGVLALCKSLGKELAGTGILVNAIAPAAVRTPILAQMADQHVQTMVDKSPMQRLGEPDEVAALVAWLASDACSFSTGAVFDLSGGRATY
jgi:NAD(P)-dependent dehydrogenase (short-subunit alcohol dehydrogenase family)